MEKIQKIYDYLKNSVVITLGEAKELGISPMTLSRAVKEGKLIRVCRNLYTKDDDFLFDSLGKYILVSVKYPDAVIALISSLTFHGLTDEEEKNIWISIPHKKKIVENDNTKIIRPKGIAYELGIEIHKFHDREIKIYDKEKSVIDAFKYLTEEVGIKSLKYYLKQSDKDIQKLLRYSKQLGRDISQEIKMITTE